VGAESNPGECFQLNAQAVLNLANACNSYDACLITISSDYVFDGTQRQPYKESAKPNPLNTYGISKVASEHFAAKATQYKIVRISSLFGLTPNRTKGTFIHNILQRLKEGEVVRVYDHHTVTMSFADDVAKALLQLTGQTTADNVFHLVNEGPTSWYGFAAKAASHRPGLAAGLHVRPEQEEAAEKSIVNRPTFSALANTAAPALPSLDDAIERFMLAQKIV
jgi:dTDP-4-dehydrorhamnose reductase